MFTALIDIIVKGKDEKSPAKDEKPKEKEAELTSPGALLNKLEEYVSDVNIPIIFFLDIVCSTIVHNHMNLGHR